MKMFDYTNLLNVIKEVDLETAKLNNVKEMALKNKYLNMERKLFNSGILEDWNKLNKLVTDRIFYSRWKNKKLNSIYEDSNKFIEYMDNVIAITMSSDSSWTDYLYIKINASIKNGKIIWGVFHTTTDTHFEKFENEEEEYKTKIIVIETLIDTYEDYRDFVLEEVTEKINKNLDNNKKLRSEIAELI